MSNNFSKLNKQSGIVTMEILIALGIIVVVISAVILVVFSNQTLAADSQLNNDALYLAQQKQDEIRKNAESDFDSVNSSSFSIPFPNGSGDYTVSNISQCLKQITTRLEWTMESRPQYSLLDTLVGNPEEALALGGDCVTDPPQGDWRHPYGECNDPVDEYCADIGGQPATDVDVVIIDDKKTAFLTSSSGSSDKADFWIFDVSNSPPDEPILLSSLDLTSGLNAVDIAKDSTGKFYAYVAGYYEDQASPCGGGAGHKSYSKQFYVIDVTIPTSPIFVKDLTLSTFDPCGDLPAGYTIFYHAEKVYIGTKFTSGDELTIIDVSDPVNPIEEASKNVQRNVNDIIVRDGLAYLATGPGALLNNPLKIIDVDPDSVNYLNEVGSFIQTNVKQGTELFLLGDRLYLGTERNSAGDDFFVLNINNPSTITKLAGVDFDDDFCIDDPDEPSDKRSCLGPNTEITGIVISSKFAFISTSYATGGFQVWDISEVSTIENLSMYNYSEKNTGMDFLDNKIYLSNESNNALRIVIDKP